MEVVRPRDAFVATLSECSEGVSARASRSRFELPLKIDSEFFLSLEGYFNSPKYSSILQRNGLRDAYHSYGAIHADFALGVLSRHRRLPSRGQPVAPPGHHPQRRS